MPLYNEEKTLAKSVKTVVNFLADTNFPYPYTLTLANNASTDKSWKVCLECANAFPQVRAIDIGKKGKGLAIRTAWSKSESDFLVFMDCDLASDLLFLRPLVEEVIANGAHLAIGNRHGRESRIVSRHPIRKIASHIFNLSARILLKTPFADHQCGFKAMSKKAFDAIEGQLNEEGWLFDAELLAHSVRRGYSVASVDIVWKEGEESKVSLFSDSIKMFGDLFSLHRRI